MKTLHLPYDITIELYSDDTGSISSNLHKDKHTTKVQADVLESLILAHACEGANVEHPAYIRGLHTCIESLANNS